MDITSEFSWLGSGLRMTNQLSWPPLSEVARRLSEARPAREECRKGPGWWRVGR